jgi:hypothetical protein
MAMEGAVGQMAKCEGVMKPTPQSSQLKLCQVDERRGEKIEAVEDGQDKE